MRSKVLVTVMWFAAAGWCIAVDAVAQPALTDHRIMVSEHTLVRKIGSLLDRKTYPVNIKTTDVPQSLVVGEEGLFSAQVNVEVASLPLTLTWDFGDGTDTSGLSVRHTFTRPGRYEVRFKAANRDSEASATFDVVVRPNDPGESIGRTG